MRGRRANEIKEGTPVRFFVTAVMVIQRIKYIVLKDRSDPVEDIEDVVFLRPNSMVSSVVALHVLGAHLQILIPGEREREPSIWETSGWNTSVVKSTSGGWAG